MRMLPKLTVPTGMLLLIIGVASSTVIAQQRPDLEGIWTNASLTNLQRPGFAGESLVVDADRALEIAARTPIAGIEGGLDEGDGFNYTPEA